jgi:predicted transcriptional regulator
MPLEMKPHASMHPRALASMKPKDRPKTDPPKIDQNVPSLKMMRDMIVKKKPADKEVAKYLEEVIDRLKEAKEREDDGES